VGAIGYEQSIFVVGGQTDEHGPLPTVECFDLEAKSWLPNRPLKQPRRGLALALLDYQGKKCIYAIGGMGTDYFFFFKFNNSIFRRTRRFQHR
jgi:hypothetical protein